MVSWSIPRMFEGRTVAVLATGPSLSQAVADSVHDLPTIVVNDAYRLAPWADLLYAADHQWWDQPGNDDARRFAGLKVTVGPVRGVLQLQNVGVIGYSDDPGCLHTYGNSGMQAIQIAAKAGAIGILLFGFDMRGSHFFGEHPAPLANTSEQTFANWIKRADTLAAELRRRGVHVMNCTTGSALQAFPMSTFNRHEALAAHAS